MDRKQNCRARHWLLALGIHMRAQAHGVNGENAAPIVCLVESLRSRNVQVLLQISHLNGYLSICVKGLKYPL